MKHLNEHRVRRNAPVMAWRVAAALSLAWLLHFAPTGAVAEVLQSPQQDAPAGSNLEQSSIEQPKPVDKFKSLRDEIEAVAWEQAKSKKEPGGLSPLEMMELVFAGILAWRLMASRVAEFLTERFNPWDAAVQASEAAPGSASDEESFAAFAATLKTGPLEAPRAVASRAGAPPPQPQEDCSQSTGLDAFFANAREKIPDLRKLFSRIGWCKDEPGKQQVLEELLIQIRCLKKLADLPEVRPAWQVAAALEGLLSRLALKPAGLTPSCLRTAVSALDLLTDLCVPGVRPCLTSIPPVRLLAVDDDAICRLAVSSALKQVFTPPELAVDGKTGLAFAEKEKFDMIFLDVEMPGMNGFELCAKIRRTSENGQTPVVFVTNHSDFNSRAQLPLADAQDLIAKPFMSFELALKALTFILRGRLAESRIAEETASTSAIQTSSVPTGTTTFQSPQALCLSPQVGARA